MAKYLKNIVCYSDASFGVVISAEVCSVFDMYSYYLQKKKVDFDGVSKIVIILSETEDFFVMEGVATIRIVPDVDLMLLCKLSLAESRNVFISFVMEVIISKFNCSPEKKYNFMMY
ncbi:hypothetical protein QE94_004540 [Salmonella enterica subsp. enterica]|nr:hypothetical protein [Salmonella enterica subsp. enterica]